MLISAPSNRVGVGGKPERLGRSAELLQIAAKICQPLLSRPPLRMREGGCSGPIWFLLLFFLWVFMAKDLVTNSSNHGHV